MRDNIRDFKEEELKELWEEDAADWIYIKGQVHFRSSFLRNIIKTRKAYGERVINPELAGNDSGTELLDTTICAMEEAGGQTRRFHMKITIGINSQAERDGSPIRVYIPIPIEYAQIENFKLLAVRIGDREAAPEEYTVAPPAYAHRTVCFETIHRLGQKYQVEFVFENHAVYVDMNSDEAIARAAEGALQNGAQAVSPAASETAGGIDDPSLYLGNSKMNEVSS